MTYTKNFLLLIKTVFPIIKSGGPTQSLTSSSDSSSTEEGKCARQGRKEIAMLSNSTSVWGDNEVSTRTPQNINRSVRLWMTILNQAMEHHTIGAVAKRTRAQMVIMTNQDVVPQFSGTITNNSTHARACPVMWFQATPIEFMGFAAITCRHNNGGLFTLYGCLIALVNTNKLGLTLPSDIMKSKANNRHNNNNNPIIIILKVLLFVVNTHTHSEC